MDRVTATSNYARWPARLRRSGQWAAAYSYFEETLHFRPDYAPGPAPPRRAGACCSTTTPGRPGRFSGGAAAAPAPPRGRRRALLPGPREAQLGRPAAADRSYTRALALDSTRSAAYLARGEVRLLDLHQPAPAVADFTAGLARRRRPAAPPPGTMCSCAAWPSPPWAATPRPGPITSRSCRPAR